MYNGKNKSMTSYHNTWKEVGLAISGRWVDINTIRRSVERRATVTSKTIAMCYIFFPLIP